MKKGVNPVARHGVVCRLHNTDGSSATHLAQNLSSRLKIWASILVGSCRSPSRLARSSSGGQHSTSHSDVVVVAEVEEFLPRELGAAVGDDCVGYAKAIDDVSEE
jgi:hypothetical protein